MIASTRRGAWKVVTAIIVLLVASGRADVRRRDPTPFRETP